MPVAQRGYNNEHIATIVASYPTIVAQIEHESAKQPGLDFGCVDVDGTVCEVATLCEELLSNLPDDWHDFSA